MALCSSTATTGEAPQVTWRDLDASGVALAGRTAEPGREETLSPPAPSFSTPAAARHVTDLATLADGAAVAGVGPWTHRQIAQLGDRRLLRAA